MTRRLFLAAAVLAPLARFLPFLSWAASWRGREPFRPIDAGPEPWSKEYAFVHPHGSPVGIMATVNDGGSDIRVSGANYWLPRAGGRRFSPAELEDAIQRAVDEIERE